MRIAKGAILKNRPLGRLTIGGEGAIVGRSNH